MQRKAQSVENIILASFRPRKLAFLRLFVIGIMAKNILPKTKSPRDENRLFYFSKKSGLYGIYVVLCCVTGVIKTDEQKEVFEKFDDCWSEYMSLAEAAIFEYAFQLGMNITIESLYDNN